MYFLKMNFRSLYVMQHANLELHPHPINVRLPTVPLELVNTFEFSEVSIFAVVQKIECGSQRSDQDDSRDGISELCRQIDSGHCSQTRSNQNHFFRFQLKQHIATRFLSASMCSGVLLSTKLQPHAKIDPDFR